MSRSSPAVRQSHCRICNEYNIAVEIADSSRRGLGRNYNTMNDNDKMKECSKQNRGYRAESLFM